MALDIFSLLFCGSLFFFLAYHTRKDLRQFKKENKEREHNFEQETLEWIEQSKAKQRKEKREKRKEC